ncbi:uncharacterized protein B0T15DRAFT_576331 [Chaetomium strumarium]|uniref:Uncharacterized protein n=1 Tax=Chaetomium strumarium TaxID=1170767 RepID=A0AAJ0LZ24_9PEZI|nr:hypothetical protein B0T15DRAFT_576331 [Chaetomium strumarium]
MSLGAVRVPVDSLEFLYRRQISFKVRERLGRVFRNLSKAGAAEVRIPCTVDEGTFEQIIGRLGLSADQLRGTRRRGQRDLPLLTGVTLSCLYGDYLVAAAKGNKEASLIVHLFSADQLYQKIIENYYRDRVIYALCMGSLTGPKERNMKMLLRPKNLPIVEALNSLFNIPAMIEQLRLGNIHKWLALYIDKQIINYLNHISVVWKQEICQGKKTIINTIRRLFDNGMLFPRVTDSSDRDILRRNVLSLDMVILSFETFQENMYYVGLTAKILMRYVVDELPLYKSSRKRSPTIFKVLSGSWTAPEVVQVEADDGKMTEIKGPDSFRADVNLQSQDTQADDNIDEEMGLDAENEQGDRAPIAPRTAGDKIRPRSRYFRSAAKARHRMAASVIAKAPRQDVEDRLLEKPQAVAGQPPSRTLLPSLYQLRRVAKRRRVLRQQLFDR